MNLVAIHAAHSVRRMNSSLPVPDSFVPLVAALANAIRRCRGALAEADDFRNVSAAVHV
jgi:hypothetical protein